MLHYVLLIIENAADTATKARKKKKKQNHSHRYGWWRSKNRSLVTNVRSCCSHRAWRDPWITVSANLFWLLLLLMVRCYRRVGEIHSAFSFGLSSSVAKWVFKWNENAFNSLVLFFVWQHSHKITRAANHQEAHAHTHHLQTSFREAKNTENDHSCTDHTFAAREIARQPQITRPDV